MVIRERFSYKAIHDVLSGLLEQDLHAKRAKSLCDATLGVLHSGWLAVCTIGQGLTAARSLKPKHAIKQSLPLRKPAPAKAGGGGTGPTSMPTNRPPSCWH
jgi:hypothetical protein